MEAEYFVQLFVEHDESLKLPTIADLLKRMFKDQKILFTKVYAAKIKHSYIYLFSTFVTCN